MKLIVNADDYGKSMGINHGIIDAYKYGVLTSTTIMANGKYFEHGISLLQENPGLGAGVHLVLTYGKPLTAEVSTITDENGNFFEIGELIERLDSFDEKEIEAEFRAQIKKVEDCGIRISHLDGHHHVHTMGTVLNVTKKLAKELNVPIRWNIERTEEVLNGKDIKTTEDFSAYWYDENVTEENFINIMKSALDKDSMEIMCHPAYIDNYLYTVSLYSLPRMVELEILMSNKIMDFVKNNQIQLINYHELY